MRWHWACRLTCFLGLVAAVLWWLSLPSEAAENPKYRIEYWRQHYDELRPQDDPRAARAHTIFQRVLHVAGSRPGVEPRLYITKTAPWNLALPVALLDGWVILSIGALESCYRDPARGDDRLAFVFGHEIAHHLKDDFWHVKFFQALEASKTQDAQHNKELEEARSIAGKTYDVLAKELQADEHGIVYAAMAGFNPEAVVSEDEQVNFFEEWVRALDLQRVSGAHRDPSHLHPAQRAATVKARLRQVLEKVELFRWGLRFHYAGMYQHAVHAFTEFRRFFPSREVYHNLATSHHELALFYYRAWKKESLALPWKLSLAVDPVTRALKPRREPASSAELYKDHLAMASEFYQKALALDPTYMLAYNNLGAVFLLQEDMYKAIGVLQDAFKLQPEFPELLNNLGVAFLMAENPTQGRTYLHRAHELAPTYEAPLFNLGKLAHEARQPEAAQQAWTAYLQLDATSHWAEAIRQTLKLPPPVPGSSATATAAPENLLGIHSGTFVHELPANWGKPVQRSALQVGKEHFNMVTYNNGLAVVLQGDTIRLLTTLEGFRGHSARGVALGSSEAEVRAQYGASSRIVRLGQGSSWGYAASSIAFQFCDGRVVSWLVF